MVRLGLRLSKVLTFAYKFDTVQAMGRAIIFHFDTLYVN